MNRDPGLRSLLEAIEEAAGGALCQYVSRQRWFGAKGRDLTAVRVVDWSVVPDLPFPTILAIITVQYDTGGQDCYFLPMFLDSDVAAHAPPAEAIILTRDTPPGAVTVVEATFAEPVTLALVHGVRTSQHWPAQTGQFFCRTTQAADRHLAELPHHAKRLSVEQSNTSIVYDRRLIFKIIRKLEPGINPDREILEFLTTRTDYRHIPHLLGAIEYHGAFESGATSTTMTVGVLERFIPNQGDAWNYTLEHLRALLESQENRPGSGSQRDAVLGMARSYLQDIAHLGAITGMLHMALASDRSEPAFRPEPVRQHDLAQWQTGMLHQLETTIAECKSLPSSQRAAAGMADRELHALAHEAGAMLRTISSVSEAMDKIRIHGDYHLGQVLKTEDGFVILDFEGEPARPLEERRAKSCALKDVAGMLRSFSYAVSMAQSAFPDAQPAREDVMATWEDLAAEAFWRGYQDSARSSEAPFLPTDPTVRTQLLRVFQLDKAVYELRYELNHRPHWIGIPLRGIARLLRGS